MKLAEIEALAEGLAPVIRDLMAAAIKPLVDENADLKRQIGELLTIDHSEAIRAAAIEAVRALPVPKDGADGKDGAPGERGADGAPGRDGEPGKDGRDGVDGINGKDGEQGREGPPGKLAIVKEWTAGVHYGADVVAHMGGTYQALKDTAEEPGGADWICLAAPGVDGLNGRSMVIRGTYAEDAGYFALDVVALNGGSFVAKSDDPGPCPGPGWQLLASQGKSGKPGDRGAPGPVGRGEPGAPVIAASIDGNGLLTLVNGDGSTVECDLYPVLAKVMN